MYISVSFAVFGYYLSVWVQMKQQLKRNWAINESWAWRSTVKHNLIDFRGKLGWGWSCYTERAA